MNLTYEWKITGLKKQNDPSLELNDIIVQTYWTCKGIDIDGYSGIFNGATPFEPDQVDPLNFTLYEVLTEEQVIGWIQDMITTDTGYWSHINEQIEKQITLARNPITESTGDGFPWAPPAN